MSQLQTALASTLFLAIAIPSHAQEAEPASLPKSETQSTQVDRLSQQVAQMDSDVSELLDRVSQQVTQLESDVSGLQRTQRGLVENSGDFGVLFLFGAFGALWAQNTGRRVWLWFLLGMCFSIITVIVLLAKNAHDRRNAIR